MRSLSDRITAVEARQPQKPHYDLSCLPRDILELIASLPDNADMSGLSESDQARITEVLNGLA